jgi:nitrogen fixation protein FixH
MAASSAARRADPAPGRLYPWLFVAAMGLVILVNAAMIFLAVHSFSGLATQDAYAKGLAFDRTLAAARAQAELGWQVDVAATPDPTVAATVTLSADFRDAAGRALDDLTVRAFLVRPTSAGHDRAVDLADHGQGRYRATAALPLRGEWLLTIVARRDSQTWQSTQRVHLR